MYLCIFLVSFPWKTLQWYKVWPLTGGRIDSPKSPTGKETENVGERGLSNHGSPSPHLHFLPCSVGNWVWAANHLTASQWDSVFPGLSDAFLQLTLKSPWNSSIEAMFMISFLSPPTMVIAPYSYPVSVNFPVGQPLLWPVWCLPPTHPEIPLKLIFRSHVHYLISLPPTMVIAPYFFPC